MSKAFPAFVDDGLDSSIAPPAQYRPEFCITQPDISPTTWIALAIIAALLIGAVGGWLIGRRR